MKTFIREKKIYCGKNYLEVDIFSITETERKKKKKSRKRTKESLLTQRNKNDKNTRRKFIQLTEANFNNDDLHVSLTYNEECYPQSYEEACKNVDNFLRKIDRERKKRGLERLKYILVTDYAEDEEGNLIRRPHHHVLINKGLDRDLIEKKWSIGNGKNPKRLGWANAYRLQHDFNTGFHRLCEYIVRHRNKQRKYSCSTNLIRPESTTNDNKFSYRKLANLAKGGLDIGKIEKMYKGWTITDKDRGFEAVYNDYTGWAVYLKLRRKQ